MLKFWGFQLRRQTKEARIRSVSSCRGNQEVLESWGPQTLGIPTNLLVSVPLFQIRSKVTSYEIGKKNYIMNIDEFYIINIDLFLSMIYSAV